MSDDCWRRLEAIEEQTCWEVKEPVHLHASGARIAQRRTWPLASLSTVTRCLEIYGHPLPRDLLIGIGRGLVSTASSRQRSTTWTPNMDACLLLGEFLFFYFFILMIWAPQDMELVTSITAVWWFPFSLLIKHIAFQAGIPDKFCMASM